MASGMSESELLRALDELRAPLAGYAWFRLRNQADVDEVVQDALFKIWRNIGGVERRRSFSRLCFLYSAQHHK